jgi:hypothetical protein
MNEPNSRTWSYEMGRGVQTSHGRGRWFEPSIAHSGKVLLCSRNVAREEGREGLFAPLYTSSTPTRQGAERASSIILVVFWSLRRGSGTWRTWLRRLPEKSPPTAKSMSRQAGAISLFRAWSLPTHALPSRGFRVVHALDGAGTSHLPSGHCVTASSTKGRSSALYKGDCAYKALHNVVDGGGPDDGLR